MYHLQPYRPTGSFFNMRRTPKRSPATIVSIALIGILWFGMFTYGFNAMNGASIFLTFGLLVAGTIAIPLFFTFGWQAIVNSRLGEAQVRIDNPHIYRGAEITCEFIQPVKSRVAVRNARMQLILHEWVQYQQGTDTYTKTHNQVIDEISFEGQTKNGGEEIWLQARFHIPTNAMHNINYSYNRLQWLLVVTVDIPSFPDFYEEYTLDFRAE
jgi:hypothetical protein